MKCRTKSRRCAVLAAVCFLAVVCLLAAVPRTAALARGFIDTGRECSLTVKTEIIVTEEEGMGLDWAELNDAKIQAYLYRVADIGQYGEYVSAEGFAGLGLEDIGSGTKADDWREKARQAADILGLPIPPKAEDVNTGTPGGTVQAGSDGQQPGGNQAGSGVQQPGDSQAGSGVQQPGGNQAGSGVQQPGGNQAGSGVQQPGSSQAGNDVQSLGTTGQAGEMELPGDLPDKLARADAVITVENGAGTEHGLAQGMYLVWVMPVETDSYQYTFLPYLISLPNNSYDPAIPGSVDEWEYETTVGLKPRQNTRYGSLRIRKTLNHYNEALGEAMFVFQVEARKDLNHDGEKEIVYSNVVGLEFNASGQKEAVIEHIPAGAEVTVEEIYSGSAYTLQGSSNIRQVTVWADDGSGTGGMAEAEFTNDYDNRVTYGTGAVNHFTHDGNGWLGKRLAGTEGGGGE